MTHHLLRSNILVQIAIAILCLTSFVSVVFAQMPEGQAQELAKTKVQNTLGREKQEFVHIVRDTALEELFLFCSSGTSAPYFFRASNEGRETRQDSVTEHLSVEGPLKFVVAVTPSGRAFLIRGALDSTRQLEELASEVSCRLSTADRVRDYLKFFLDVDPERLSMTPITSSVQLKDEGERKFRATMGDVNGMREFGDWWAKYGIKVSHYDFKMNVSRTTRGYSATFYILSAFDSNEPRTTPRVLRATLAVSALGRLGKLKLIPVRGGGRNAASVPPNRNRTYAFDSDFRRLRNDV